MQHTKTLLTLALLFSIGSAQASVMEPVRKGAKFVEGHSKKLTDGAWKSAQNGAVVSIATRGVSNIAKQVLDLLNKKRTSLEFPGACMKETFNMAGFNAITRVVTGLFTGKEDADTYSHALTFVVSVLRALKGDGWIS